MALSIAGAQAASPLSDYIDTARVLVVSAPRNDDPELAKQIAAARGEAAGMKERDLVIVRVEGGTAKDDRGATLDAGAVRQALTLPVDRFEAVLVGKDGGAKLRSPRAIPTKKLFSTIDAMPMRQNEMRSR